MLPTVSVIIATWRRDESLRLVLDDLARQEGAKAEIVVVDQNTPPTSEDVFTGLRRSPHELVVVPHAPGVVIARNEGARRSLGEVLVFIDDDVRIDDVAFIQKIASEFVDPTLAGLCGQELSGPDYRPSTRPAPRFSDRFEEAAFFPRDSSERREVFHLATCNCAVRRSAWEKVGGLDPVFAGNSYGDDTDLALRMRAADLRIIFEPSISVRHTRAPMGGLRLDDPLNPWSAADRYVSLWIFFIRHVPPRWRRWYLRDAVLGKSLLLRQNFRRPWRWPAILGGLLLAARRARQLTSAVQKTP